MQKYTNMPKEDAKTQFKLSRDSSGLPKVSISLRTSFKNRRCTDTALRLEEGRQNDSQNPLIGLQRGPRTAPRSFKLATAQATTIGPPKISIGRPCRIVASSNFGPQRLARLYIYIYIYIYLYIITIYTRICVRARRTLDSLDSPTIFNQSSSEDLTPVHYVSSKHADR